MQVLFPVRAIYADTRFDDFTDDFTDEESEPSKRLGILANRDFTDDFTDEEAEASKRLGILIVIFKRLR